MSWIDEYNELARKRNGGSSPKASPLQTSTNSWINEYNQLANKRATDTITKKKKKEEEELTLSDFEVEEEEIAPTRTWFDTSVFDKGVNKETIGKAILGTLGDIGENVASGIIGMPEQILDAFSHVGAAMNVAQQAQNSLTYNFDIKKYKEEQKYLDEFAEKDLYNEQAIAKKIIAPITTDAGVDTDADSLLGERSDSLVQAAAQMLATRGLSAVGVPWQAITGLTAFGAERENALREGATHEEAGMSAAISAGAEVLSESLFGGSMIGEKGMINLDPITRGISSKLVKTIADWGVDATAEGFEEVVSEVASRLGSALYKEENLTEILTSEEAFDAYLESFVGGMALGGIGNIGKAVKSGVNGTDYRSDFNQMEQAVVDKLYEQEVSKKDKLTAREKTKLYESISEKMEKGYISAEDIESVLGGDSYETFATEKDKFFGGETYKSYKENVEKTDSLQKQIEELGKKTNPTLMEQAQFNDLRTEFADRRAKRTEQKKILDQEAERIMALRNQMRSQVIGKVSGTRLEESYRELERSKQKFQADVSKYQNEHARKTVESILKSGLGDNTNQFHDTVEWLASISEQKGVTFDLTSNDLLQGTQHYREGYVTNGFVTEDGVITLNTDSDIMRSTVGHEITHVLEKAGVYKELQSAVRDFAISKEGLEGYNKRMNAIKEIYGNNQTKIDSELTADIVGEYLFTDSDFVNSLSANRSTFEYIYNEIKHLWKMATAGSKEKRELERVKRLFDHAWQENVKGNEARAKAEADEIVKKVSKEVQKEFDEASRETKETNDDTQYSIRKEAPPTKTEKAYKLMRLVDGDLYPLFIGNNEKVAVGTWYNADSPNLSQLKGLSAGTHLVNMETGEAITWDEYAEQYLPKKNGKAVRSKPNKDDIHWANDNGYRFMHIEEKSGASASRMEKQYGDTRAYYNWGVNGSAKSETGEGSASLYALRPGWHFGEVPSMHQIGYGGKDEDTFRLDNQVWVEVEMSADVDYNEEAASNWGGDIPTHIPTDGYYKFATNPTQKKTKSGTSEADNTKADWYVAGAFKVNRILSDSEADAIVNEYNQKNGKNVPLDYRRSGGRVFNAETMSVEDSPVKPLEGGSVTKYSLSTWTPEMQKKVSENLVSAGFAKDDVDKWIADTNGIAAVIASDKARLDFEAHENHTMVKDNNEYYKTIEASTLCAKRLKYQGTFDEIQYRLPNTTLTSDMLIELREMMKKNGHEVPCGACYVESRRRHLGKYATDWLNTYDGEYIPTLADVTTTKGLEKLRTEHPQTYSDFIAAMNKKGVSNPKVVELRTEYRGEIMKIPNSTYKKIMKIGGLRLQSFSDFETPHLLDMMQVVHDMASRKFVSQAYTKVPNFAWVLGDTNIKINLSLIPSGTGVDANGELTFDPKEGMDINDAMRLRDRYSKNVGTTIIGINDEHILKCMADDRIDYIIPFHRSGWGSTELKAMGLDSYIDYTKQQRERDIETGKGVDNIDEMSYWDFSKTGKENAETYLAICAEKGVIPKFERFLVDNGDGSFSLQPDGSTDGYWKTLINFKMYDNDGVGSPHQAVVPNFNMEEAYRVLNEYEGGANSLPVADDVVEEFVKKYQEDIAPVKPTTQYSMTKDSEGNDLTDAQAEFFKDSNIRDDNGNLIPMYHGTANKFTIFDVGRSGDNYSGWSELGQGIYLTPSKSSAEYYADNAGRGRDTHLMYTYANIKNPFNSLEEFDFSLDDLKAKYQLTDYDVSYMQRGGYRLIDFLNEHGENVREYLISKGYDGVWDKYGDKVGQVVAYYPEQIKNVDNIAPTIDPDIRYSMTKDTKQQSYHDYLDAVNSGDTDTAQKLLDGFAKDAGYNYRGVHRSFANFTVFDREKIGSNAGTRLGDGFYVTLEFKDEATARYADESYGKNRMNLYVKMESPLVLGTPMDKSIVNKMEEDFSEFGWFGEDSTAYYAVTPEKIKKVFLSNDGYEQMETIRLIANRNSMEISELLKQYGFDSVIDENDYVKQAVVFDETQLKSAEPITYDEYGDVIMPYERFNQDNMDIRFSISKEGENKDNINDTMWSPHNDEFEDFAPIREDVVGDEKAQTKSVVGNADEEDGTVGEVKTKLQQKIKNTQAELDKDRQLMEDHMAYYDGEIAKKQAEYDSKKNKNSQAAQGILRSIERLKRLKANSEADYSKRISDLEQRVEKMHSQDYQRAEVRRAKQEERKQFWADLIGDTSSWKDFKLGVTYKTKTLRRILRNVVRDGRGNPDIQLADAIYDELETKYDHNEAKLKVESGKLKGIFKELNLNHYEDQYAQMLGEFRHNPETTLSEDVVNDFLEKHKDKINEEKVNKAIHDARMTYDQLIVRVNKVLKENGIKEIPYRQGYFPHFINPKQNWLQKLLNWKPIDTEIPTSIAGLTQDFKPNKSWQSFAQKRKGDKTDYSLYQGLDTYIHGALDWIYHIDDIQNRRALENYIRELHSDENIEQKIQAIRADDSLDADEVYDRINAVLDEANNPLSGLVRELMNRTNTLANKKSSMDREMEDFANRKVYSTLTNLNNRINANMVVGSFSSALTNFIPMVQSWHQVSPVYTVRGLKDMVRSTIKDDGIVAKSDFLTNRLVEEEKLYKTWGDKASDKAAIMMNVIDNITSQTVWRSKYLQNIHEGMSESAAIRDADQFAKNLIAGRSRGNMPSIFDAKNPFTKIFTAFQLEVANQYGYMFEDAPKDTPNKVRLAKGYATAFLGAYMYNALYSSLVGRDAAFDPIAIIQELIGDLMDDEEEPEEALANFGKNILEETPFIGGLLGGGRIPMSSAIPYSSYSTPIQSMVDDVQKAWNEGNFLEGDWTALSKEMLKPLYYLVLPFGGGQIKKTNEGIGMFSDDHPIAGSYTASGRLRFPVEDTFGNRVQAAMFGQYANKNARDYFDEGRSALTDKQLAEYMKFDAPIQDYWEYRDGLKGLDTIGEKADYINSLDLPISTKNMLINNQSDRKTPIDLTNYGEYDDFEEFDWATKNPEKYEFFSEMGISYRDYKKATDAQKDDYNWAYKYPHYYTLSKSVTSDVLEYRKYYKDLDAIKSTDEYGNKYSTSVKTRRTEYIDSLDIDYGAKLVLFKSFYKADDSYNAEIFEYIKDKNDLTFEEKLSILKTLGYGVSDDGTVTWD